MVSIGIVGYDPLSDAGLTTPAGGTPVVSIDLHRSKLREAAPHPGCGHYLSGAHGPVCLLSFLCCRLLLLLAQISKGRGMSNADLNNNPGLLKEESYLRTKGLEGLVNILQNMLR